MSPIIAKITIIGCKVIKKAVNIVVFITYEYS